MDEFPDRRGALLVAGLLVGGTILVGMVFMGGQVSTILSTVGSSVTDHSGGGSADITDGGSDTTGGASTGGGTSGQVADAAAIVPTLLIVRTGELTIQVPDLAAAFGMATRRCFTAAATSAVRAGPPTGDGIWPR